MFLKRVEMSGFKSFADKTIIHFNHDVTGIVGPNGCGKSNIAEAIRWVLGEQSVKSLRSESMSDVIFNGSSNRRMVNLAQVTLVFNNKNKILNIPYEEVSITRKIHRNVSGGEYFINNNPVRLRDIVDLIADSGIGKDSLSMISQGNVSHFAQAKPSERRLIFEEAAGVAKYKKRKNESVSKLYRTQENIDRVSDIVYELEKQVNPLKRAAKKASLYLEKKKRLESIEIAVLVFLIDKLLADIKAFEAKLFDLQTQSSLKETALHVNEVSIAHYKDQINTLDKEVAQLQEELMEVVNEIQILETRKIEIDERRKYELEVGNSKEKGEQLSSLLQEAQLEYEDRRQRRETLKVEIDDVNQKLFELNKEGLDLQTRFDVLSTQLSRSLSRKEVLKNIIERPFISQAGVHAILQAKASLAGVIDSVAGCLHVHAGYELAIDAALGAANAHIVVEDERSARQAIAFLKQNQSGRATFVPLSVLKSRYLNREAEVICENTNGFLGVASEFVDESIVDSPLSYAFLNNVIVVEALEQGNHLAALLNYNYKIVTLDGDVIHRGGTMSGGKIREHYSLISAKAELQQLEKTIQSLEAEQTSMQQALSISTHDKKQLNEIQLQKRIALAQLEPVVDAKRSKYERLKNEFEMLDLDGQQPSDSFEATLVQALNDIYFKRDQITSEINTKRESKVTLLFDLERKEKQVHQLRKEFTDMNQQEREVDIELTRMKTNYTHYIERLNGEYSMTIEYARTLDKIDDIENAQQEVLELRSDIHEMGNINMDAPTEYEQVNERYEFLLTQLDDLVQAKDKLLTIIEEMDTIMVDRFKQMIDDINEVLPEVFGALFGGGKARLILDMPNDLLHTGVDIEVFPPGKTIQSINLFSGGEKSLIAISILFAILKVRHVPLCVFDEVEASLDQANVEKFANYLKTYSHETQFIVITHRPGTMSECDVLYGVTMPEDGVSEMIRVQLIDAIKIGNEQSEVEHGIS